MQKNPTKITVEDQYENIKTIQEYKYNKYGDPILFTKIDNKGKKIVDWKYEYQYDQFDRKIMMEISDLITEKKTIMKYEY